jgi:tRNA pseudouridine55 synthase
VRPRRPLPYDAPPAVHLHVAGDVSSGTYVRALARDLGQRLGVGGHLTALRRTRVGPYGLDRASTLEELAENLTVLSPAQAAAAVFPVRTLTADETTDLRHGKRVRASGQGDGPVAALDPGGELVALLEDRGAQARSLFVVPLLPSA